MTQQVFFERNLIAHGSQAEVVEGKTASGNPVAVKIFPKTEKGQQSFTEEARILAKIKDHSNVVQVVAVSYGECYIAMKKYDCDLFGFCFEQEQIFRESDCKKYFRKICKSLYNLHTSFVAHLDIKPENILVDLSGSKKFHLCDFGLSYCAKTNTRNETITCNTLIGTEQYLAPEVARQDSKPFNPFAADIYSLGCVYYTMLTGCFCEPNKEGLISIPSDVQISTQGKLFIEKLLAPNPENRPSIEQILSSSYLYPKNRHVLLQSLKSKAISLSKAVYHK